MRTVLPPRVETRPDLMKLEAHIRKKAPYQVDVKLSISHLEAQCKKRQMMPAHLLEAAVVLPLATHKDRIDRGLYVVVDPALAGPTEEGERLVVRERWVPTASRAPVSS